MSEDLIRRMCERAAELEARLVGDAYAKRWAANMRRLADVAVRAKLSRDIT